MLDLLISYYTLLMVNLREAVRKTERQVTELTEAYLIK